MEYLALVFLHVASGVFWAGGAVTLGVFVIPSVSDAGPAGATVMTGLVRRRLPTWLLVAGFVTVTTGLGIYVPRFSVEWLGTPQGIVITMGALAALEAFIAGLLIQRPTAQRLGALAASIAATGVPPPESKVAEVRTLQKRLRATALFTAINLIVATLLMALHRFVAVF